MDRDRVMPLDGQIDLKLFSETVKSMQYDGYINLGVYNKKLWDENPLEVARLGITRLRILFE